MGLTIEKKIATKVLWHVPKMNSLGTKRSKLKSPWFLCVV
jgi:hypothetical protein